MITYYRVDIRRLSWGELWRITRGPGFLVALFCKAFNLHLKMGTRIPRIDDLILIDTAGLNEDMRKAFEGPLSQWKALGFREAFIYTVPVLSQGLRGAAAALLSADGLTAAQVMFAEKRTAELVRREVFSQCLSFLSDGSVAGVGSGRPRMESVPGFHWTYRTGAAPELLVRVLGEMLQDPTGPRPQPLDVAGLRTLLVRISNRAVDFQVERGVYVPE
jgi:hypothetical protein